MAATAKDLTPEEQAVHVLNRLAYGPRPGDLERVMQIGVDRYIAQQLDPASMPLPMALQQRLDATAISRQSAGMTLGSFLAVRAQGKDEGDEGKRRRRETVARMTEETATLRLLRAIDSPRQLEEVMVDFWFNHFNVFAGKGLDRALVASYERDAIRPHAMGSFRDLLGATARHPAMLFYLDNYLSRSANERPRNALQNTGEAKARKTGLNENYARELMELHTLGVDAGYSQHDVTELARMLTGWTFEPRQLAEKEIGFRFNDARHDAGDKDWLGHHVTSQGEREGDFALDILAQHPATAHRISFLLAQYFVQDDPPPALVERMAHSYLTSHGTIRTVLQTLFYSPEFRSAEAFGSKFKTPYQFVVSAVRAAAVPVDNVQPLLGAMNQLGMPLYGCQTPDGYKNTEAAWLNPDALSRRIGFASTLAAGRMPLVQALEPVSSGGMRDRRDMMMASGAITALQDADTVPILPTTPSAPITQITQITPITPVAPESLLLTLGQSVSPGIRRLVDGRPRTMQAAMLLGSPDFMRH